MEDANTRYAHRFNGVFRIFVTHGGNTTFDNYSFCVYFSCERNFQREPLIGVSFPDKTTKCIFTSIDIYSVADMEVFCRFELFEMLETINRIAKFSDVLEVENMFRNSVHFFFSKFTG